MLTPLDIEGKEFKKKFMGYSTKQVDEFLNEVIYDYEKLYRENIELHDKITALNEITANYKKIEDTLQNALILAEKTAEETKGLAYERGEQIKKEAELRANQLIQDTRNESFKLDQRNETLKKEYIVAKSKFKQLLLSQLELLDKMDLSKQMDFEPKKSEENN